MNSKIYRGVDITRPFNLSADLLRKYESWNLVPYAKRGENNYRQYNETHKRFFETIRKMMEGYTWTEVANIMELLVNKDRESAIILAVQYQADIAEHYRESSNILEQLSITIGEDNISDKPFGKRINRDITYKEVSKLLNIPISTLRVWEQQHLFIAKRGENNYRYFSQSLVNRLFIIKFLRLSGLAFDQCLEILKDIEEENYNKIITVLQNKKEQMRNQINKGLKSLGYLNSLINYLEEIHYFTE